MENKMRDDFSEATKKELAAMVGYKCSNPCCRRTTIGPKLSGEGTINLGEAAHIKAASPGGKRYDPDMTPEERAGYENGIWMCRTHAALIDRDEKYFTVELLYKWKQKAEESAGKELIEGEGTIRKCKFRMNIFYRDLKEYISAMELFKMRRGVVINTQMLPIQNNWEEHLKEISELIGPELTATLYNINRIVEEFRLTMEEEARRLKGGPKLDYISVIYCQKQDFFMDKMQEWLTKDLLETIKFYTEI